MLTSHLRSFNFVVACASQLHIDDHVANRGTLVVYFALTAYKFLSNIYVAEGPGSLSLRRILRGSQRSQPVIHLFVRDGSIYFLVVVGTLIHRLMALPATHCSACSR